MGEMNIIIVASPGVLDSKVIYNVEKATCSKGVLIESMVS